MGRTSTGERWAYGRPHLPFITPRRRRWSAVAALTAISMTFAGVALADDIGNNLDGSVDAPAESITLIEGGPDGSVGLLLVPRNGDGKNGCNIQGTTERLDLAVVSSDTTVATVTPTSVTFDDCGDTPTLTVTPLSVGTSTISLTETSNTTSGTFNLAPATFTVTVEEPPAPPNTSPSLSLPADITAEATSAAGAAVTYTVGASDAEDDPDPTPICSPTSGDTFAIGSTTVNCTVTDAGGLSDSGSFSVAVVDTTPPTLSLPVNITAEATGPGGAAVTFTATATDLVDGSVAVGCSPSSGSTFPLGTTTVNCSATDAHTNTASGSFTVTVVDTTPPQTSIDGHPADPSNHTSATFTFSGSDLVTAPGALTFECDLDGAGFASCSSPRTYTGLSVGPHTFSVRATDGAGNTDASPATYTWAVEYGFGGFFAPIDNLNVNSAKAGQAIPIKWRLTLDGQPVSDPGSFMSVSSIAGSGACAGLPVDAIEEYAGSSGLQYLGDGNWQYNWKTPKTYAGQCRTMKLNLSDGTTHTASFLFK